MLICWKERQQLTYPNTWKYLIKKSIILVGEVSRIIDFLINAFDLLMYFLQCGKTFKHEKLSNIIKNHNDLFAQLHSIFTLIHYYFLIFLNKHFENEDELLIWVFYETYMCRWLHLPFSYDERTIKREKFNQVRLCSRIFLYS